jgi:hypothetical protein
MRERASKSEGDAHWQGWSLRGRQVMPNALEVWPQGTAERRIFDYGSPGWPRIHEFIRSVRAIRDNG